MSTSLKTLVLSLALLAGVHPGAADAAPGNRGNDRSQPSRPSGPSQRQPSNRGRVVVRPRPQSRINNPRVVIRDHRTRRNQVVRYRDQGYGYGRDRRIVVIPARSRDDADRFAAEMFVRHAENLGCSDLGNLLRGISNDVLESNQASYYSPDQIARLRRENYSEYVRVSRLVYLHNMLQRPVFTQIVMSRLTDAFAGCDLPCFDDGVAVGIISGQGYCVASVDLDGLDDNGFQYQERLPVCETANYVGCQQGYAQAVNSVQGCLDYATGEFEDTYLHSVSEDCHTTAAVGAGQ